MIEWISSWLKNIIIIVLLATFVDLILPNSNMQKYARTVLGLLIILTIISPILSVFSELPIDQLINQVEEEAFSNNVKGNNTMDAKMVNDSNYSSEMIKKVETSMLEESNKLLSKKLNLTVSDLQLDATLGEKGWSINKVTIYAREKVVQEEESKTSIEEVKSIKKVDVSLEKKASLNDNDSKNKDKSKLIKQISEILENEWGISKERFVIIMDDGKN